MDLEQVCFATFHCEYDALVFERTLKQHTLPVKLLPVPRSLSSSCGIAARFALADYELVQSICSREQLAVDQLHLPK